VVEKVSVVEYFEVDFVESQLCDVQQILDEAFGWMTTQVVADVCLRSTSWG
jgi:hypothetical protein